MKLWLGLFTLCLALPAYAHHSFAVYDHTRSVTLRASLSWPGPM